MVVIIAEEVQEQYGVEKADGTCQAPVIGLTRVGLGIMHHASCFPRVFKRFEGARRSSLHRLTLHPAQHFFECPNLQTDRLTPKGGTAAFKLSQVS